MRRVVRKGRSKKGGKKMIRKYASQYCMQKESKEVVRRVRSKNWGQFLPLFKAATVAHGLQVRR